MRTFARLQHEVREGNPQEMLFSAVYVHFEVVRGPDVIDINGFCWISMTDRTAYAHFFFESGTDVIDFRGFDKISMTYDLPYARFEPSQTLPRPWKQHKCHRFRWIYPYIYDIWVFGASSKIRYSTNVIDFDLFNRFSMTLDKKQGLSREGYSI